MEIRSKNCSFGPMLKAVIFDMDGVIVDSEPFHSKAFYALFDELEIEVTPSLYSSFTGKATLPICEEICTQFSVKQTPEELVARKRIHFKKIFEQDPSLQLIEGVLERIKEYHAAGLTLVLASSASMPTIHSIFSRFELYPYFKALLSGADLKASKPHPEIFQKATKATGFTAQECMVIEDATNGIKAAKAAGLFCVAFRSFHSKNQDYSLADKVIERFSEIALDQIKPLFEGTS